MADAFDQETSVGFANSGRLTCSSEWWSLDYIRLFKHGSIFCLTPADHVIYKMCLVYHISGLDRQPSAALTTNLLRSRFLLPQGSNPVLHPVYPPLTQATHTIGAFLSPTSYFSTHLKIMKTEIDLYPLSPISQSHMAEIRIFNRTVYARPINTPFQQSLSMKMPLPPFNLQFSPSFLMNLASPGPFQPPLGMARYGGWSIDGS